MLGDATSLQRQQTISIFESVILCCVKGLGDAVLVTVWQLDLWEMEALLGSISQFPWCKYFHYGHFQAANMIPLKQSWKDAHNWHHGWQEQKTCPGQYGAVGWASSHNTKGHRFHPQSGHMPGLRVQSLAQNTYERQPINVSLAHWCFSPSLSPSLALSLKIIFLRRYFKKKSMETLGKDNKYRSYTDKN